MPRDGHGAVASSRRLSENEAARVHRLDATWGWASIASGVPQKGIETMFFKESQGGVTLQGGGRMVRIREGIDAPFLGSLVGPTRGR